MGVTPFMDRRITKINKMQLTFIQFIVAPLFATVRDLVPEIKPMCRSLANNAQSWAMRWREDIVDDLVKAEREKAVTVEVVQAFENGRRQTREETRLHDIVDEGEEGDDDRVEDDGGTRAGSNHGKHSGGGVRSAIEAPGSKAAALAASLEEKRRASLLRAGTADAGTGGTSDLTTDRATEERRRSKDSNGQPILVAAANGRRKCSDSDQSTTSSTNSKGGPLSTSPTRMHARSKRKLGFLRKPSMFQKLARQVTRRRNAVSPLSQQEKGIVPAAASIAPTKKAFASAADILRDPGHKKQLQEPFKHLEAVRTILHIEENDEGADEVSDNSAAARNRRRREDRRRQSSRSGNGGGGSSNSSSGGGHGNDTVINQVHQQNNGGNSITRRKSSSKQINLLQNTGTMADEAAQRMVDQVASGCRGVGQGSTSSPATLEARRRSVEMVEMAALTSLKKQHDDDDEKKTGERSIPGSVCSDATGASTGTRKLSHDSPGSPESVRKHGSSQPSSSSFDSSYDSSTGGTGSSMESADDDSQCSSMHGGMRENDYEDLLHPILSELHTPAAKNIQRKSSAAEAVARMRRSSTILVREADNAHRDDQRGSEMDTLRDEVERRQSRSRRRSSAKVNAGR